MSGRIQQSHQLANTVGEKRHPAGCKLFSVVWRKRQRSTAAVSQALLDFKGQDVILALRLSPLPVDSLTGGTVNHGLIYLVVCPQIVFKVKNKTNGCNLSGLKDIRYLIMCSCSRLFSFRGHYCVYMYLNVILKKRN